MGAQVYRICETKYLCPCMKKIDMYINITSGKFDNENLALILSNVDCTYKIKQSVQTLPSIYRMIDRVLSTFKLVQGHLNGIFLTVNFAWGFSGHFVNRDQKDRANFPNFDSGTVCDKTLSVSGGVYLPAFWATHPYYSITCYLGHTTSTLFLSLSGCR